ncbi:hypothetical protein CROQUDRAFT_98347 [Cronartium quercuum f. sp. fusiforme G11]|uniref:Uncharacterized protein n=1 Tax=Cronartium quercuum f. sp. fusiforme G11 TaxID=708437 RepID=A0A9P6ND22_9BASI|nr:hypothetical protein CROQUDRAFT_98347 [Cronartium quercuum f. sp. fusiforme G11]
MEDRDLYIANINVGVCDVRWTDTGKVHRPVTIQITVVPSCLRESSRAKWNSAVHHLQHTPVESCKDDHQTISSYDLRVVSTLKPCSHWHISLCPSSSIKA